MRTFMWFVWLCCLAVSGRAQGFFNQNGSRIKDYEEQIVEMEAYLALAAKGFAVVQSGLSEIGQIKQGEFNLHSAYYTSLGQINPAVSGFAEVAEIVALQVATVERFKAVLHAPGLGASELAEMQRVYAAVVQAGINEVTTLMEILTAGTLTMSDDQRASGVDGLYESARQRYLLSLSYTDGASMLAGQRQAEAAQLAVLQGLLGVQ